jgi:hypothetical protein
MFVRGGYMLRSTWSTLWHSVRASAGMPGQEFYELKHRAIQWMVDPVEDGGLGLDPATVAEMVGHDDGGHLIATIYTKLAWRRARWTTTSSELHRPQRLAVDTSSSRLLRCGMPACSAASCYRDVFTSLGIAGSAMILTSTGRPD